MVIHVAHIIFSGVMASLVYSTHTLILKVFVTTVTCLNGY